MDRERFDALARLLATTGSRRGAIGALVGAGLFGTGLETEARKRNGKRRGGGGKGKSRNRRNQAQAEQLPARCCSRNNCTPGPGKNLYKCCYENANVSGKNFSGANLGQANFSGANATGANFQGANAGGACFVDANLTNAKINSSTNLGGAIFCRTTMPDGSINNSGCFDGTRCCPTCEEDSQCGDGAVCCGGNCVVGDCCSDADCEDPDAALCLDNVCSPCGGDGDCAGDQVCCDPICTDLDIDESNCGACGVECGEGATCRGGECVFVVSPANLRGWRFIRETPGPEQVIPPTFEVGPGDPPFGNGSAELKVTEPPAAGKILAANIFVGTPLADLETLEYSVHVTSATSNTAPSLQLGIDFDSTDGNDGWQGRMVYVPSETAPFPQGQWITIDALADNGGGNWFFTRQVALPNGSGGACPSTNKCNFSEILGLFPNIRIHPIGPIGPGAGFGFIGFKVGSGEGSVEANVDSVRVKLEGSDEPITVYTFEENP